VATPGSSLIVEVDPNTVTAASLNALIASLAGPLGERDGGATIVLPSSRGLEDGRYKFDEPIKIRQHVVLEGEGPGTLLAKAATFDDSEDSAILINAVPGDRRFTVRNLGIDASGVSYGIHIDTPDTPGAQEYADGIYTIENVEIFDPLLDGIWLEGRGQAIVRGIRVRDAERHGYVIDAVDSVYDALEAGGCGSAGLVVRGSNSRFANCKFFYSGRVNAAEGHGIWLDGSVSGGQHAVFVNCETQDNEHHGVLVQDFHKVWIQNHISEGNNAGNNAPPDDQDGNAYHICGSSDVKIRGTAVGRTPTGHTFKQKHAIGMQEGAANLKAELISDNNEAGHILNGWHEETDIRINNYDGNRYIKLVGPSGYTPDPTRGRKISIGPFPFSTPTSITINNPLATNIAVGNKLEFVIRRGIYSLSVTWGSEFKLGDFSPVNAIDTANVYTFRRYPGAWILVSAMAGVDL
jgi:hypothetical protein